MERYRLSALMKDVEMGGDIDVVIAADAQRALDGEREKVKRLSTCGTDHSTPWWQVKCEDLEAQLATLQAQLAAAKKVKADYDRWLSGGVYFTTAEYEKHVAEHQAQLRQVEEALQERKEFIADCDTALDRIQAPRTNEGQEELVSTWRRIELLGKLLYQYRQELERSAPALRAENARLRGLLAEIQFDCEHIGGIQHLDKAERRTWVSVANRIKAALQPKEAQP